MEVYVWNNGQDLKKENGVVKLMLVISLSLIIFSSASILEILSKIDIWVIHPVTAPSVTLIQLPNSSVLVNSLPSSIWIMTLENCDESNRSS